MRLRRESSSTEKTSRYSPIWNWKDVRNFHREVGVERAPLGTQTPIERHTYTMYTYTRHTHTQMHFHFLLWGFCRKSFFRYTNTDRKTYLHHRHVHKHRRLHLHLHFLLWSWRRGSLFRYTDTDRACWGTQTQTQTQTERRTYTRYTYSYADKCIYIFHFEDVVKEASLGTQTQTERHTYTKYA